jgi:hypothetical protein
MFLFRPLTEFMALQKTFLAIQRISRAGWKAATPYVWRNLTFTRVDDYLSFFAPITRFSNRTPVRKTLPAKVRQAASLANGDEPARIDLWNLDASDEEENARFWNDFEILNPKSRNTPLVLHDLISGQLSDIPYKNLTISMSPGWHWMYDEGEANRTLAIDLGIWVYDTVLDEYGSADPTADGDEVQAQMTVTGWSGCPCKCDEDMYPLTNTRLVLAQIKQYATNMSRNIMLSQGPTMAERIQTFFDDRRLKLTVAPCERYKARVLAELAWRQ